LQILGKFHAPQIFLQITPLTFAHEHSDIQLRTTNGGIRCTLPRIPEFAVKIDGSASTGKVTIDVPNFVVKSEQRFAGRQHVVGEVRANTEQSKSITLNAHVITGSISVVQQEEHSTTN